VPSRQVTLWKRRRGNCIASALVLSGLCCPSRRSSFGLRPRPDHAFGAAGLPFGPTHCRTGDTHHVAETQRGEAARESRVYSITGIDHDTFGNPSTIFSCSSAATRRWLVAKATVSGTWPVRAARDPRPSLVQITAGRPPAD